MATPYFVLFNNHVAGTITAQGRDLTKTMDRVNEDYWYNIWHTDTELHKKLCIKNVTQIDNSEPTSIYADTDSCFSDSIIQTQNNRLTIEKWYNDNIKNGSAGETVKGHESVLTNDKILNYSDDGSLYYAPVKRIIRHKVSKAKWRLKTKSGKEIIVTNDHSMIVFRDGVKIEVKPSEILKTDKVLSIYGSTFTFNSNQINYIIEEIESCEQIGFFEDEFVYDVEVDDGTHTFIANDILVHNSLFVSFKPAIDHCEWKNLIFNEKLLNSISKKFIILSKDDIKTSNTNCILVCSSVDELVKNVSNIENPLILIDGCFVKDRQLNKIIKSKIIDEDKIKWNWSNEIDFIHGLDHFRYAGYFKDCLDEYANSYGVTNKEDFELERISESIINIAKKKYIQHIIYEDGIPYDRLNYIFPKGVELVRSSTPAFAREKIVGIVKYLFANPDDFNIKDLLKLVKNLRREFELADIDDIAMQSSVSKYEEKVLDDKERLSFVTGAHFAVKAVAYYNYLLHRNSHLHEKYEYIKSGTKIKYYYCKDNKINDMFAYIRGSYPLEMAPEIDYDIQFEKCILSPINSIIEPLGMPLINKRLRVVMDLFGSGLQGNQGLTVPQGFQGSGVTGPQGFQGPIGGFS